MKKILVFGATSAIAEASTRLFASEGDKLYLVARNVTRLERIRDDLRIRGAVQVETSVMDANSIEQHAALIERATAALGGLDIALIAHGTLPDQKACEKSVEHMLRELQTNCTSTLSLVTHLANWFEQQGQGTIAVISSVAGERGRQSNYVYGAAKAAVSAFLQGVRNRLHKSGVHVLTIKPGFVDTPMTSAFEKGPLWAQPEVVARGIQRAIKRRRDVVYLPLMWRAIMLIIRLIPEPIFKRLSL
ncbi:MAG: SDR family oxidoreductase [Gammaproteobacteria bacterium]